MSEDAGTTAGGHAESLDRIAQDLAAVEAALQRLDDGTYGRCATCGAVIGEDLLAEDPLAAACAEHRAPSPEHQASSVEPQEPSVEPQAPAPVTDSEGAVGVLAGDDPLSLGGEYPEG